MKISYDSLLMKKPLLLTLIAVLTSLLAFATDVLAQGDVRPFEVAGQFRLRVVRVTTDDGQRIVGIRIPSEQVGAIIRARGASRDLREPEEIFGGILNEGEEITLVSGLKLCRRLYVAMGFRRSMHACGDRFWRNRSRTSDPNAAKRTLPGACRHSLRLVSTSLPST